MKRLVAISFVLSIFILNACGDMSNENVNLHNDRPPNVSVEIDNESYHTKLGSYCWDVSKDKSECVDTGPPKELLKDEEPIKIKAGE